ncbi:inactive protein kinase-like protein [Tanacetum coccineum]
MRVPDASMVTAKARPLLDGDTIDELIDPRLGNFYSEDEVICMLQAASLCIKRDPYLRPRSKAISSSLLIKHNNLRRFTRWTRANNFSYINRNFNLQSHQQREIRIPIRRPISYYHYLEANNEEAEQEQNFKYCSEELSYIDSAFRSTRTNEVYLFFENEYVVFRNNAPEQRIAREDVNGPVTLENVFTPLVVTYFVANRNRTLSFGRQWW